MLSKKLKKNFFTINNSIENYFHKLRSFISNIKKAKLYEYNRVVAVGIAIALLTLVYFLIPTFYNKELIQLDIKNQIYKKYNIDIKFNSKIKYGLLPLPNFNSSNLSILQNEKVIAEVKNFKVFIKINKFFSINEANIKDMVFKNADFNFDKNEVLFFNNLLNTEPNANKIFFKNSNIFFRNKYGELLFINKIKDSEVYYDSLNLRNVVLFNNEVFNIPYKLVVKKDKFNKKIISNFKSNKIRLNVENIIDYNDENIKGLLDILFINKNTSFNYEVKKNSLHFESANKKNFYNGNIDFKPFYFSANLNYEGLSSKNLINDNSILIDLINTEIFNNKNLNANLNMKVKVITNINELNNLLLKVAIQEGDIDLSDSVVNWKDDVTIKLNDAFLITNDDGIDLIGKFSFDFKNLNDFYSSFQIKKKNRKKIKKIKIDFVYNFNNQNFKFSNVQIDDNQNIKVEKFIDSFNSRDTRFFNKITFKNFLSNFFNAYDG